MEGSLDDDDLITMSQVATRMQPITWCPRAKIFNCPIHQVMRFDPLCLAVIDTPQFQRLRDLKQLGLTHYVYPGATHTRFDHSLGVGHLAHKFASNIKSTQGRKLNMEDTDITCVTLAGLCHDLGHGPFSHVFDHELLKRMGITNWRHEDMSCRIFETIVEQLPERADGSLALSECDVRRIKNMIDIEKVPESELQEKRFLYDIVANKRNGVDVDKFDYLARDSYYCGVKLSCDHTRIMNFSQVCGDQICFSSGEYSGLFEVFHSRQRMHREVYSHAKAKSVEFMVVDALMEANKVFNFIDRIHDPARFIKLDDTLLKMVENCDVLSDASLLGEDRLASLHKAQALIQRLRYRRLYKFVNEVKIPTGMLEQITAKATADSLVTYYRGGDLTLDPADVIFSIIKIDYAQQDKNPMDNVRFFDNGNDEVTRTIHKSDVSHMMMEVFQEHSLRLYSRNSDAQVVSALGEAFLGWKKEHLPTTNFKTPLKVKPEGQGNTKQEEPCAKRPRSILDALDAAEGPEPGQGPA